MHLWQVEFQRLRVTLRASAATSGPQPTCAGDGFQPHPHHLAGADRHPIIGVNTFLNPHGSGVASEIELGRSTEDEKQSQLTPLKDFQARNAGQSEARLARLRQAVIGNRSVFEVMIDAVRCCSLGQISNALYEVGGQYRRSM